MASNISILLENSIINPGSNPKYWIDNSSPLSFFDFLKHIKQVATPIEFNDKYNEYLHSWYEFKGASASETATKVRDRYIELLKDISINFTTAEERRFLSNIDFNDPQDLAIAIPFYSSRIAEICKFYTRKREEVKYKIEDNKIKGTLKGIEKTVFNAIIDYVFVDGNESINTANIALSSIIENLDIEVEELFDIYSDYFNIDSDLSSEVYSDGGALRNKYFTANSIESTSDVGDLFVNFDISLRRDIFNKPLVLSGFGNLFSLNIEPTFFDLVSNESIQSIIEDDLPESDLRLNLKKQLLEKYIGTDIYYLSTNSTSTQFVSGVLFKSQSPSKNLINSRFATIAAVPSNSTKTLRDIGLFFTPDKLGLLHFKTGESEYRIRRDGLIPNKIYVFPDPEIYGNISNVTDEVYDYPLYYIVDNSKQVKPSSFGFAVNDVYNTSYDQLFYAYSSAQEKYNSYTKSISSLESFNLISNKGIISDWRQDVYGNQYGLIKKSPKRSVSNTIDEEILSSESDLRGIVIDGYLFRDGIEGFQFNYSIDTGSTFNSSLRTGITGRTIDELNGGTFDTGYPFASGEMFNLSGSPIRSLYFREFDPYISIIYPGSIDKAIVDGEFYDAIQFKDGDGGFLTDPILADSESFNESIVSYYNTLVEAGMSISNVLGAVVSGEATFLIDVPLSAGNVEISDGGSFRTEIALENDYPFINNQLNYYNLDNTFSSTVIDINNDEYYSPTIEDINKISGIIYVHNIYTDRIEPLSSQMGNTFSTLPQEVQSEIYSSAVSIDVNYDTIVIDTDNYLIIDKIIYDSGEFELNSRPNIFFNKNEGASAFSKPFFTNNNETMYFCRMSAVSSTASQNEKSIYPEIHKYDAKAQITKKIYPVFETNADLISLYALNDLADINIITIKQPNIIINSRNDAIAITVACEDGNGLGYILSYIYNEVSDTINLISSKIYRLNTSGFTHNFSSSISTGLLSATDIDSIITKDESTGALIFN